jgi:hypothetical protein
MTKKMNEDSAIPQPLTRMKSDTTRLQTQLHGAFARLDHLLRPLTKEQDNLTRRQQELAASLDAAELMLQLL